MSKLPYSTGGKDLDRDDILDVLYHLHRLVRRKPPH